MATRLASSTAADQSDGNVSSKGTDSSNSNNESPEKPVPARNLTQAFEALCVKENSAENPSSAEALAAATEDNGREGEEEKSSKENLLEPVHTLVAASPAMVDAAAKLALISPTGVAELQQQRLQSSSASSPNKPPPRAPSLSITTVGDDTGVSAGSASAAAAAATKVSTGATTLSSTTATAMAGTGTAGAARGHPYLDLHPDLRRDLSQALVNRVSFYAIIHDINKEASAMASNDVLQQVVSPGGVGGGNGGGGNEQEERSPLVVAALGGDAALVQQEAAATALIDEEEWLLTTIASRSHEDELESRGGGSAGSGNPASHHRACPDTFLQAMGEKEYENPVASLAGNTRTQLWKPSRSWWEAKSGKNPWIEPSSHNKRWR